MLDKIILDYFTFSKKERTAVITLSVLLVIIFSLPHFIPDKEAKISLKDLEAVSSTKPGAERISRFARDSSEGPGDRRFEEERDEGNKTPVKRFRFDPNTLDVAGWQSLGVREKTARTIHNYISKGGQFRRPEDLAKVYGLNAERAKELMPYVHIKSHEAPGFAPPPSNVRYKYRDIRETDSEAHGAYGGQNKFATFTPRPTRKIPVTDIGTADSLELVNLPGIGPRLAVRIINFRDKLGGFYAIDQLSETFGLPDSTFQLLKPFLKVSGENVRKIQLNNASLETLRSHPYIRWNLANAINVYRSEHGPFKETNDLLRIDLVTPQILTKLLPYLEP